MVEEPEQPEQRKSSKSKAPSGGGGSGSANLGLYFVVSVLAAVAVVAAAAGINHAWPIFGTSGGGTATVAGNPTAGPTAEPKVVEVDVGDAPTKGPADAKVTIVEFSDFQCPYCGRFVQQTLPQILQNNGDKVLFAYKNFPLTSIHDNAEIAAEAAECANEQGAFWEYHDVLFQNQTALDAASLKGYAATLGLDTDTFNQCLDSGKYKDKVAADSAQMQKLAQEAGLTNYGTPTFFINGHYIGGAYPYDTFKQVIDAALQEAG